MGLSIENASLAPRVEFQAFQPRLYAFHLESSSRPFNLDFMPFQSRSWEPGVEQLRVEGQARR